MLELLLLFLVPRKSFLFPSSPDCRTGAVLGAIEVTVAGKHHVKQMHLELHHGELPSQLDSCSILAF